MKLNKIIVPTDFSEYSFSALSYASDLAEKWEAEIHLVYVLEEIPAFFSANDLEKSKQNFINSGEDIARKKVKELTHNLSEDTNLKIIPVLRKGINYEQIISYSKEIDADLIVIATHGRTGVLYTLLGSVAEKVIQFAKCPVLVVKLKEEEI